MVLNSLFNLRTNMKLHEIYDSDPVVIELTREHNAVEFLTTIDSDVFKITICEIDTIPGLPYSSIEFGKKQEDGTFTMDLQKSSKMSTVVELISAIKLAYTRSGVASSVIVGVVDNNHNKRERFYKSLLTRFGALSVGVYKPLRSNGSSIVYGIMDTTITEQEATTILQNINIK
jgi:hypothetical protein